MWRSATSSEAARAAGALLVALAAAGSAAGTTLISAAQALHLAFPGGTVRREVRYLTPEQIRRAERLSGETVPSALVTRYRVTKDGKVLGFGYLDTHRVRTLPETLLVIVDGSGRLLRVEVLAFREPRDYLPRRRWYDQFAGRRLDGELKLQRGIRMMTGATLTSRATTAAVRRVLALHAVLGGGEAR